MTSTARTLRAFLRRVSLSHGFSSSLSSLKNPSTLQRFDLFEKKATVGDVLRLRRIWTSPPVCMGRRSCKIAGRKDAQNLKKMKRNGKIGKEIVAAVKKAGPNPKSNTTLAAVLEKARELDVPKEIVERNIKKASEKGQETYIEKFYEVYGFGGVGMVVEVLTDKITRSVAAVRGVVKDSGAKLADPGSILFKFRRVRVVNIKATDADKDQLLVVALDAGAEDVIEPTVYDDDSEEDHSESYYKIVTEAENYSAILSKLQDEGIAYEPDNGFELLPLNPIEGICVNDLNSCAPCDLPCC
uniref:Probable transcriptional regulatory protein At2g25830 isoform X2 n=1 Tax=Elaeis guineensis var. tenera TaxID=51953 RepID=A0A6J0PIX6_ELAGV|nr:probable transcriptional regulatory protein At2g25830 isoform X2 [Elaeis guineensis]